MGTSDSFTTPAGGEWTAVKRRITSHLAGGNATPSSIVGGTVSASGGFSFRGGGGSSAGGARRRIAGVVSGVGGFGAAVRDAGLDTALERLGLEDLRGRSAHDVVGAISEHLAADANGLDREYLQAALTNALLDAASMGDELGYDDFAEGLGQFLQTEGPEGLVQLFLEHYVFDSLWGRIEQHVIHRSADDSAFESLMAAVKGVCVAEVRDRMSAARENGSFAAIDWFGRTGRDFGLAVVIELEQRLSSLREQS